MYTKKRVFSLFTTFVMLFAFVGVMPTMEVGATQDRSYNFNKSYSLSGNGAIDIVNVAKAQIGKTGSQLGYSEQWCADFVSDCARLANQSAAIPSAGYCPTLQANIGKGNEVPISSAQAGDIAFYGSGGADHVEIVYANNNGRISTIGGNSGSGSSLYTRMVRDHATQSMTITKVFRPNYSGNPPVPDTEPPVITNSYISQINSESFRVTCDVDDNVGIDRVKMATWTTADQSDIIWRDAYFNGVSSWFIEIPRNDYMDKPAVYITHIYAYDAQNNYATDEIMYWRDTEFPKITNKYISEMKSDSFRIVCEACDNVGIDRVRIATWTTGNQSDVVWRDAYFNGIASWYIDIPTKDYRENSEVYISHIYVYDTDGNTTAEEIIYYPDHSSPEFIDAYLSNITDTSFRVVARVKDSKGVDSVKIATWTTSDQSDLIWREAVNNGYGDYFVDIPVSEHSQNPDVFISHIYAYNSWNISSTKEILYWYKYNISFNPNGGLCNTTSKTVTHASTYGSLPTPTRNGYTFDGWYTASSGGTKITSTSNVSITANQTLYAHWEKINVKGDINNDSSIGISDVLFLQQYLVKSRNISSEQFLAADMNDDGTVNIFDMIILKRKILKG